MVAATVKTSSIDTRIARAFGDAAKSGATHRAILCKLFMERKVYDPAQRPTYHEAFMRAELSLSEEDYAAQIAAPKDRCEGWKAADMRFRANLTRSLNDAGLENPDAATAGNATRKPRQTHGDAGTVIETPVTVETMVIPTFKTTSDARAWFNRFAAVLGHTLSKNSVAMQGDECMALRDAATAFQSSVKASQGMTKETAPTKAKARTTRGK